MRRLPLRPRPRHCLPLLPAVLLLLATQLCAAQTLELSPVVAYRVGGGREFGPPAGRAHPFGNLGIALSDLSANNGGGSATRLAMVFGGGAKVFANRSVGLRFDARAYLTFVNSSGGFY